jgi:hypothetical protein
MICRCGATDDKEVRQIRAAMIILSGKISTPTLDRLERLLGIVVSVGADDDPGSPWDKQGMAEDLA